MKMRAHLKGSVTEVKVLISHPMETGRRENEQGGVIPAHFIQLLTATLNGVVVLEAQWGTGVSRDPYLTFYLHHARVGDEVAVIWHDNRGETGRRAVTVSLDPWQDSAK